MNIIIIITRRLSTNNIRPSLLDCVYLRGFKHTYYHYYNFLGFTGIISARIEFGKNISGEKKTHARARDTSFALR